MNKNPETHEEKFTTLEKKATDEMEMAAKENEEREKIKKAAQVNLRFLIYFLNQKICIETLLLF